MAGRPARLCSNPAVTSSEGASRARPGKVTLRDRVRRLPNSVVLWLTFVLAVASAILATLPYEVGASGPLPPDEISVIATATSTSSTTTTVAVPDPSAPPATGLPGTTTSTVHVALETQPRVTDGALECASPLFEIAVPGKDRRVARNDDCLEGARWRLSIAAAGAVVALVTGLTARRIRLKEYERVATEERRRRFRRARDGRGSGPPPAG